MSSRSPRWGGGRARARGGAVADGLPFEDRLQVAAEAGQRARHPVPGLEVRSEVAFQGVEPTEKGGREALRVPPADDRGEDQMLPVGEHELVGPELQLLEAPVDELEALPDEVLDRDEHAAKGIGVDVRPQAPGEVADQLPAAVEEKELVNPGLVRRPESVQLPRHEPDHEGDRDAEGDEEHREGRPRSEDGPRY